MCSVLALRPADANANANANANNESFISILEDFSPPPSPTPINLTDKLNGMKFFRSQAIYICVN